MSVRRWICFHAVVCAVLLGSALLLALPWESDAAVRVCGNAVVTVLLLSVVAAPASVALTVAGWRRMRGDRRRFLLLLAPMLYAAAWTATVCVFAVCTGGV